MNKIESNTGFVTLSSILTSSVGARVGEACSTEPKVPAIGEDFVSVRRRFGRLFFWPAQIACWPKTQTHQRPTAK